MPFGSASVSPWYGLAARVGTGARLPVTVVSAVQHASSPCSQGRFESGRSLACRTSPMAEASRSGRGGLRFESAVRYGRRNGERTDQGSGVAANDCAANAVVFESPTLLGGRTGQVVGPGRKPGGG